MGDRRLIIDLTRETAWIRGKDRFDGVNFSHRRWEFSQTRNQTDFKFALHEDDDQFPQDVKCEVS